MSFNIRIHIVINVHVVGRGLPRAVGVDDPEVELRKFPQEVLDILKTITDEIVAEWVANDPAAKKIADSYYAFLEKAEFGQKVTEQAYLETRA